MDPFDLFSGRDIGDPRIVTPVPGDDNSDSFIEHNYRRIKAPLKVFRIS
jgi:hypothetical protein